MSDQKDQKNTPPARKPLRAVRTRTSGRGIAEQVRTLVTPVADELGYVIWEVEYVKEGADYVLRITIDNEAGITIDDCERMTHAVNPVIDAADPIEEAYLLEVSSPGIERELTRDEHFAACAGERVEVRLFAPVDGSRVWTGILGGLDGEGNVTVDVMGTTRTFARKDIAKIHTVFEF